MIKWKYKCNTCNYTEATEIRPVECSSCQSKDLKHEDIGARFFWFTKYYLSIQELLGSFFGVVLGTFLGSLHQWYEKSIERVINYAAILLFFIPFSMFIQEQYHIESWQVLLGCLVLYIVEHFFYKTT